MIAPALDPLGLPEPCGRPRLVLHCTQCANRAAWVIPSPGHRSMIVELAERDGWTGVTIGPCLCRLCSEAEARGALPPKQRARRPGQGFQPVYSPELLARLAARREQGLSWQRVAEEASAAVGRHVKPDSIHTLIAYHRKKAARIAEEAKAKAEKLARQWDGPSPR